MYIKIGRLVQRTCLLVRNVLIDSRFKARKISTLSQNTIAKSNSKNLFAIVPRGDKYLPVFVKNLKKANIDKDLVVFLGSIGLGIPIFVLSQLPDNS